MVQHFRMRPRISQVDGLIDSDEENYEDKVIDTLELDSLGEIIGS